MIWARSGRILFRSLGKKAITPSRWFFGNPHGTPAATHDVAIALRDTVSWFSHAECRPALQSSRICPRCATAAVGTCFTQGISGTCSGKEASVSESGAGRSPCTRGSMDFCSGWKMRPQCSMIDRWLPGRMRIAPRCGGTSFSQNYSSARIPARGCLKVLQCGLDVHVAFAGPQGHRYP